MKLLTNRVREQLLCNGRIRLAPEKDGRTDANFLPVVKLFSPDAGCIWLLSELDPEDPDIAFGLYDLGMDYPELEAVPGADQPAQNSVNSTIFLLDAGLFVSSQPDQFSCSITNRWG